MKRMNFVCKRVFINTSLIYFLRLKNKRKMSNRQRKVFTPKRNLYWKLSTLWILCNLRSENHFKMLLSGKNGWKAAEQPQENNTKKMKTGQKMKRRKKRKSKYYGSRKSDNRFKTYPGICIDDKNERTHTVIYLEFGSFTLSFSPILILYVQYVLF